MCQAVWGEGSVFCHAGPARLFLLLSFLFCACARHLHMHYMCLLMRVVVHTERDTHTHMLLCVSDVGVATTSDLGGARTSGFSVHPYKTTRVGVHGSFFEPLLSQSDHACMNMRVSVNRLGTKVNFGHTQERAPTQVHCISSACDSPPEA